MKQTEGRFGFCAISRLGLAIADLFACRPGAINVSLDRPSSGSASDGRD